jgi:hypothetical protein
MSQLLTETIGRIFNEKKTFIESVRERRKIRQQRIRELFQSFHFSEHDTKEAVAAAAAGDAGDAGGGESAQQISTIRKDPSPVPTLHSKTSRLSFDPNNESQLQEEIQRILDRGHDNDDHDHDSDYGDDEDGDQTSEFAEKLPAEDCELLNCEPSEEKIEHSNSPGASV